METLNGVWDFNENDTPDYIYCVPDVHGDSSTLEHVLVDLTKVALYQEEYGNKEKNDCNIIKLVWNPEKRNTWIIFLGDIVDMKRSITNDYAEDCDFQILETLFKLQEQALNYNSKVIILLGNHEIMNFQGNFSYVPEEAITEKRKSHFKIGSEFARKVAQQTFLAVRINNLIMVHGGFCKNFLKKMRKTNGFNEIIDINKELIPQLNNITRNYLNGNYDDNTQHIVESYIFGGTANDIGTNYGPLWCRDQSVKNECNLYSINKYLNIDGHNLNLITYIIAHTPQFTNGINNICNGRVWCIDVGMSRAFEENPSQLNNLQINKIDKNRAISVLEISNGNFNIVTEGVLSRNFVRNKMALLNDSLRTVHLYAKHFKNNRHKLKEVFPVLKKLVNEYKTIKL
jgi:hypothetical protein